MTWSHNQSASNCQHENFRNMRSILRKKHYNYVKVARYTPSCYRMLCCLNMEQQGVLTTIWKLLEVMFIIHYCLLDNHPYIPDLLILIKYFLQENLFQFWEYWKIYIFWAINIVISMFAKMKKSSRNVSYLSN